MCVLHFLSFQILFLADSAWPPASFSWNSLKTFSFISTRSRLVLLSAHIESLGESVLFIFYSGKKKKKKTLTHTLGEKCHFRWQVVLYIYSCVWVFFLFLLHDSYYQHKADTRFISGHVGTRPFCAFLFQGYFYNDDTFNFNYAQAKAAIGNYREAEEVR